MVQDQPVQGVGIGNFADNSIRYVLEPGQAARSDVIVDNPLAAHNTYLHILTEVGIPGAAMFIGLCGFCLWATLNAARRFGRQGDGSWELISRSLLIGQIGMLAAIFFFSAQSVNKVWLVLALGPGLLAIARAGQAQSGDSTAARSVATSGGGVS